MKNTFKVVAVIFISFTTLIVLNANADIRKVEKRFEVKKEMSPAFQASSALKNKNVLSTMVVTFMAYDEESQKPVGGINVLIDGKYAGTTNFYKDLQGKFSISVPVQDKPYKVSFIGTYPKCEENNYILYDKKGKAAKFYDNDKDELFGCYDDIQFNLSLKAEDEQPVMVKKELERAAKIRLKVIKYNSYSDKYNCTGDCYEALSGIYFFRGLFVNPDKVYIGQTGEDGTLDAYMNINKNHTFVANGYEQGLDQYVELVINGGKLKTELKKDPKKVPEYFFKFFPDFELVINSDAFCEEPYGYTDYCEKYGNKNLDVPAYDTKKIKLDLTQHKVESEGKDEWVSYLFSGYPLNEHGGWKIPLKTLKPHPSYDDKAGMVVAKTGDKYYCLKITNNSNKDVKNQNYLEYDGPAPMYESYFWYNKAPVNSMIKKGSFVDLCFVPEGMKWIFSIE